MNKSNFMRELLSWVKTILIAIVIVVICRQFLFLPVTVSGSSMLPTFDDRNKIIVSKISEIEHFDNVVFQSPSTDVNYIKRVIGLPGDTLEIKNDILYINGKEHIETYLSENKDQLGTNETLTEDFTLKDITGKSKVPEGSLFVLGDNRQDSEDSREFGFISENSIIGEVKFRYFPLKEMGQPK